jgi:phosphatidylethanolamine-binding protein (PEBP) family uncharacterized protein
MFRPTTAARAATAALTLSLLLVLAACGSSGREMREPERDVTSPTRSVPTTVAPLSLPSLPLGTGIPAAESTFPPAPPGVFDISSSAFASGGSLPATFTCAGPSPALRWQAIPEGTAELALVVSEQGDGGDVYWMITGINATSDGVPEAELPVGAVQLPNSLGEASWSAPCPPPGETTSFNVALLALPQAANIPAGTPATDAYRLLTEQAAGNIAILTGTATR